MQPPVTKIIKMLDDSRPERRYAALMVLGELGLKEATIVKRIVACLEGDDPLLQRYALEALGSLRAHKIAKHVAPFLESHDDELRARALALLAAQGDKASAEIAKELDQGSPARRREIAKILAKNHDAQTMAQLLDRLGDPEIGDAVMQTLRGEIERMSAQETTSVQKLLLARVKSKQLMRDENAGAHTLRLLGYIRDGKLVATLLPFLKTGQPLAIRLAAIAGLRRPLKASKTTDKAVLALLEQAADSESHVARASIETLRPLQLPEGSAKVLGSLADSPHADVRAFAVEALGRRGDNKAIAMVVDRLSSDDPASREAASRALRRADGAVAQLLKQLKQTVDDGPGTERLVRLLVPHASELKPTARREVVELTVSALQEHRAAAPQLLRLARAADAHGYAQALTERAMKHRKAKRFDQAFALFNQLEDASLLEDDGRYAALVCGLAVNSAKKDLARAARGTSPVLRHAVKLVEVGFPVGGRLKRESALDSEDLFYLGFNFVESKDEDEKEFGATLLSQIAQKSPRSKLGKSAKNKLRLVGWT